MRSIILSLLIGCAAATVWADLSSPVPYTPAVASGTPVVSPPPLVASGSPGSSGLLGGYVADATYKLRPGDTVSYQIKEDIIWNPTDLPKSLVVTDSGELDIPLVGWVTVVNKTCQQVANEVTTNLLEEYYNKATVVMHLNAANRLLGRVFIWGAVRGQGPLEMQVNENLTAGQAILRAGGFSDYANKSKVKVVRAVPGPDGQKTIDLNMVQILEQGQTDKDIVLQPGDYILVSSKLFNF